MTYAELLRRSLAEDAARTTPPRELVQTVLDQIRSKSAGDPPSR